MSVLDVTDLCVSFPGRGARVRVVDGVSFTVSAGKTLGLIGESGCGKSVIAQSILRMVPPPGRIESGRIVLHCDGTQIDLATLDPAGPDMRRVRGREVAMVFQEPASSLSPVRTVSSQLCEALTLHRSVTRRQAEYMAIELLGRVGLPDPTVRLRDYPHQLSGGMCQRVALALALAGRPRLLIADEPTTALDAAAQVEFVGLIRQLQEEYGVAVIFITHDLRLVRDACDDVAVVYAGQVVEYAPAAELQRQPLHPYTVGLLASAPRLGAGRRRLATIPGTVAAPLTHYEGCRFADRCQEAMEDVCWEIPPTLTEIESARQVRCYLHGPTKRDKI